MQDGLVQPYELSSAGVIVQRWYFFTNSNYIDKRLCAYAISPNVAQISPPPPPVYLHCRSLVGFIRDIERDDVRKVWFHAYAFCLDRGESGSKALSARESITEKHLCNSM